MKASFIKNTDKIFKQLRYQIPLSTSTHASKNFLKVAPFTY